MRPSPLLRRRSCRPLSCSRCLLVSRLASVHAPKNASVARKKFLGHHGPRARQLACTSWANSSAFAAVSPVNWGCSRARGLPLRVRNGYPGGTLRLYRTRSLAACIVTIAELDERMSFRADSRVAAAPAPRLCFRTRPRGGLRVHRSLLQPGRAHRFLSEEKHRARLKILIERRKWHEA